MMPWPLSYRVFPFWKALYVFSFAAHCFDRVSPLDCLPVKGFSPEGGERIPTQNGRPLVFEMKDHVGVPVSIDILQGGVHRTSLSAVCTKENCGRVYGGSIKKVSGQNGHRYLPTAVWVNAVCEDAGLDVNRDLNGCCCIGLKMYVVISQTARKP